MSVIHGHDLFDCNNKIW